MAKKTNFQRMQKILKGVVPSLCKCKDYIDVSLHFYNTDVSFIVISIGSSNNLLRNKYKQFWFDSSSDDEMLKEKVNALKEYVELNYL